MLKTKVIDATHQHKGVNFAELWAHRELVMLFAKRQVASRYRQMLLGGLWAVLEPLATLAMMSVVFGFLLRVDTGGYPYPIYAFAALIPWFLFSKTTLAVASSLQENMGLISKVYFPRLALPIATACRELFDNLITLTILILLAIGFGFLPTWRYLLLIPSIFAIALVGMGVGLWVSALMVRFRDVRPLLTITLQAGMYATPIFYPPTLVPEWMLPFYQLNPMYWGVAVFRWIMLNQEIAITPMLYVSLTASVLVMVSGIWIFSVYEKMTVDVQ
ncbi:MAG: ABC transporter permease [Alphaproteobacteria bacterium]|nr:ABC transporter permease [Alphaproteobacteria bacterium]